LAALLGAALLAPLAAPASPAAAKQGNAQVTVEQARVGGGRGGGFARRSPSARGTQRSRPSRPAQPRRPFSARRALDGVLRVLGLAFLFNLLFGWGTGGSPLGLLLLAGLVLWLVTRRRARYRRVSYS